MQVERKGLVTSVSRYSSGARVSNAWVICPFVGDNSGKLELIPDETTESSGSAEKGGLSLEAIAKG